MAAGGAVARDLPHEYFGSVYEPAALARILRRAHVGFNGYRDTSAAFSYKAATYLAAGLPLLNSMSGDLETLVPTHGLGSNYRAGDVDSLLASLRTIEQSPPEHWELQSRRYFQHEVEHSAVVAKLRRFLDGCVRRPEAPASSTRSVLDEVLAVLVLYRQDLAQSPTYLSLGGELRRLGAQLDLLVYDNSEQASSLPENAPADGWRISYQHDGTNPGVSRAYVEGARLGASRGKRWLLLLDQDTVFPPGALDAYVDELRRHPDARLFAPILRVAGRIASPCGYRFKRVDRSRGSGRARSRFAADRW